MCSKKQSHCYFCNGFVSIIIRNVTTFRLKQCLTVFSYQTTSIRPCISGRKSGMNVLKTLNMTYLTKLPSGISVGNLRTRNLSIPYLSLRNRWTKYKPSCSVRHSCWQAVVPHRFMLKLVTVVRSRTCRGERRRNQHYGDSPFIHFNIFERRPRIVYFGGALSIITFMIHLEVHDAPFRWEANLVFPRQPADSSGQF